MTIYFDENFPPALARGLAIIQEGSPEPGVGVRTLVDSHRGVPDRIYIPQLAPESVLVTQDRGINRIRAEREVYRAHHIVLVVVKPPKKTGLNYWQMVHLILKHWREIKAVGRDVRPAAYVVEIQSRKLSPL